MGAFQRLPGAFLAALRARSIPSTMLSALTHGGAMTKTRKELDAMLIQLEDKLPTLLMESEESDFMEALAGETEVIEDAARGMP